MKNSSVLLSLYGGLLSLLGLLGLLGAAGPAWAQAAAPAAVAKPSLTVTVTTPRPERMVQSVPATGSLAAWQEAVVGAEANGLRVTEVRAQIGDWVKRGAVLALLQADTLHAENAQAQATLAEASAAAQEARVQAERARALQQQGFYSSAQLSQALAADASAQARVQSARALVQLQAVRLAQAQVLAPDDGVVSARTATVGSVVGAGTELFRLIRQGRLEWRAEITPTDMAHVQPGARVQITAASGQVLQGRVRALAPSVDVTTRKALVFVDVLGAAGTARAGMFARGDIVWGHSQTLTVPHTAVVVRDGFSYLYTVGADQKVTQLKVQTGRIQAGQVAVLSGLPANAQVVASGGAFLNHGDTVRVAPASPAPAVSK